MSRYVINVLTRQDLNEIADYFADLLTTPSVEK